MPQEHSSPMRVSYRPIYYRPPRSGARTASCLSTLSMEPPPDLIISVPWCLTQTMWRPVLVVQGHVKIKPSGLGRSISVLSPPPEGSSALGSRIPVTLSGIHFNGLLFAAGTITIERQTGVYGAVMTSAALIGGGRGTSLEVWYNSDF